MPQKKKIHIAIFISLVILLISLFLLRGWIRGVAAPAYVSTFYKADLEERFDMEFDEIKGQLEIYGFEQATHPLPAECDDEPANDYFYEGLKMTIDCSKRGWLHAEMAGKIKDSWKDSSQSLEDWLFAKGWVKQWNAGQPIEELFDKPGETATRGVNYEKQLGKTVCTLSVHYHPAKANRKYNAQSVISCERPVKFFGGY